MGLLEKVITRIFLGKVEEEVVKQDNNPEWSDKLMQLMGDEEKPVSTVDHHEHHSDDHKEIENVSLN